MIFPHPWTDFMLYDVCRKITYKMIYLNLIDQKIWDFWVCYHISKYLYQ